MNSQAVILLSVGVPLLLGLLAGFDLLRILPRRRKEGEHKLVTVIEPHMGY